MRSPELLMQSCPSTETMTTWYASPPAMPLASAKTSAGPVTSRTCAPSYASSATVRVGIGAV
jgi:hypothetical protein